MINTLSASLNGLQNATKQTQEAASNLAKMGTEAGVNVNFAEEAVALKISELAFEANLTAVKVADDLSKELLSTFDTQA